MHKKMLFQNTHCLKNRICTQRHPATRQMMIRNERRGEGGGERERGGEGGRERERERGREREREMYACIHACMHT